MESIRVNIRTISPIYIPIELKTGADRSSAKYSEFQTIINNEFKSTIFPQLLDKTPEYESIEKDSWEHRLFIWKNHELEQDFEIHIFPNNIGIVVINHMIEYAGDTKAMEKTVQKNATQLIKKFYASFVEQLDLICSKKYGDYFRLNSNPDFDVFIFWVSRTVLINSENMNNLLQRKLINDWLAHTHRTDDAKDLLSKDISYSMTWLNYAIVDFNIVNDERLDSMILAQYYYSAQENCNKLLKQAIDSAYNANKKNDAQLKLNQSRVITRLHQVDYHEHLKYLTRSKRKILVEILTCWNFEQLTANGQRMIEICSSKIDETENIKRERSSLLTDLLLVALSFFTVFELSLYLTELSREMMSRPALDYNDDNSSFMLQFIAEIDTDVMFGSGFFLTLLLVFVYKIIKSR
jgi:hypothetical protein